MRIKQFFKKKSPAIFIPVIILFAFSFASGSAANGAGTTPGLENSSILHQMVQFVFQVAVIIFAARIGNIIFSKFKLPGVLGELTVGVIIGPFLLGALSFPGFPHGLFPLPSTGTIPVFPELYALSILASILLLFMTGLETDISLFLRFSVRGSIIGIGGMAGSFLIGAGVTMLFLKEDFFSPQVMFMGIISVATSVGITARILSENRKMDSAEGVSILAGAVIDDVLGIIFLTIFMGIFTISETGHESGVNWRRIGMTAFKAVGIWLGFSVAGLILARKISGFLKKFGSIETVAVMGFAMALFIAGIFEKFGLAMIIGAYVMGLSLSKTDISSILQEKLHTIYMLLVPVFFTVSGMMVNIESLLNPRILIFGGAFAVTAILAKIIGCGGPSLLLGFNPKGALRVGIGMAPRGEVVLIIAGIGMAHGFLNEELFGVAVTLVLFSTIAVPPLLSTSLKIPGKGFRESEGTADENKTIALEFHAPQITDFVLNRLMAAFREESFYITLIENNKKRFYNISRDKIFITLTVDDKEILFMVKKDHASFVHAIVHETFLEIQKAVEKLKQLSEPSDIKKKMVESAEKSADLLSSYLDPELVLIGMKPESKEDMITQMISFLDSKHCLTDKNQCLRDILERENQSSTGMQYGVAIPHAKTDGVKEIIVAIGTATQGVDFNSLDNKPSKLFFFILAPKQKPHVQILADIAGKIRSEEDVNRMTSAANSLEVISTISPEALKVRKRKNKRT